MPASVAPSYLTSTPAVKSTSKLNGLNMNSASKPMCPCTVKPPAAAYSCTAAPNWKLLVVTARYAVQLSCDVVAVADG